MLTIHAFARWPDRPLEDLGLPSFGQAVEFLRADRDEFAASRRRRAVAKLAGYVIDRPATRKALVDFGVDPDAIRRKLGRRGSLVTRVALEDEAPSVQSTVYVTGTDPGYQTVQLNGPDQCDRQWTCSTQSEDEQVAYDTKEVKDLGLTECPSQGLQVCVPPASATDAILASKVVIKGGKPDKIAKGLDPQSWDTCNSFFHDTYLAARDAQGQIKRDANKRVVPDTPVAPGTDYLDRDLFEYYLCPPNSGCVGWFQNVLRVSTGWKQPNTPGGRKYHVRYDLPADGALAGQAADPQQNEKILKDEGCIRASEQPSGNVTVKGFKILQFENPVLTGVTAAIYTVMADEIAGQLADLACCAFVKNLP